MLIVLMVMLGFMEVLYQMKEYYMYVSTEHGVLSVETITGLIMMLLLFVVSLDILDIVSYFKFHYI